MGYLCQYRHGAASVACVAVPRLSTLRVSFLVQTWLVDSVKVHRQREVKLPALAKNKKSEAAGFRTLVISKPSLDPTFCEFALAGQV